MSYREIPEDKILKFPATPGFKGWKDHFTEDSITHPAKMNLNLLRWILKTYTKPGEIVLDPMAGTGSTIVLASLLGRDGVAVEYEQRFCEMISENIKRTSRQSTLTPKGRMTCIQGDARELSKLLKESDAIITSPPYSHGLRHRGQNYEDVRKKLLSQGYSEEYIKAFWNQPHQCQKWAEEAYGEDENNIGNLPHGDIDSIITSPPFGPSAKGGGIFREGYKAPGEDEVSDPGLPERHGRPLSDDPRNIDNLKYGESVDAVITSPPYEGSVPAYDEKWLEEHWDDKSDSPKHKTMRFGRSMRGYPKKVDTVVTSPPYGNRLADDVVQDGDDARISYRQAIDSIVTSPPYQTSRGRGGNMGERDGEIIRGTKYSEEEIPYEKRGFLMPKNEYEQWLEETNIGNLKSESYLEAMLQVYRECHKVLKNTGVMILVTKNFIRDKKVVRLDLDTIKLCEAAGFRLSDRWYFKLPTRSFWRILYRRKYPDVPEVEYEDVLIFAKEGDIPGRKVNG